MMMMVVVMMVEMLLPFLQANLTGFKNLEILNFRKGSVVVNSKMKFTKSVPYNITEAVRYILEEFCFSAARRLHIQIDRRSLDIEPADQADPCKFLACNAFSRCAVNSWTKEAQCLCEPGFLSVDNQPCRSVCVLQPDYCRGEQCHVIPGQGAMCKYVFVLGWENLLHVREVQQLQLGFHDDLLTRLVRNKLWVSDRL
ncbi:interphotoreceptor matrix proteoglycan 1-like [Nothobranchius furzeri]|uniref:Interphotoreceptor matrix proteoglycan 1 n=1 Tax=Nothobranchius furzeri TaxID=105023 RepID=A0A9D2Z2F4_NOTFU|nr:interphotoreceptor matrix proteoglycan 1-like [Nothobranchius furzeri]